MYEKRNQDLIKQINTDILINDNNLMATQTSNSTFYISSSEAQESDNDDKDIDNDKNNEDIGDNDNKDIGEYDNKKI